MSNLSLPLTSIQLYLLEDLTKHIENLQESGEVRRGPGVGIQ